MTSVHPVIRRQHRRSPSKAWTPVYRRVALWERRVSSHPVARVSRLAAREEQHCGPLEGANSARRLSCRLLTSGELRGEGSYSCSPRRWREKERKRERVALHLHGVPRPQVLPPPRHPQQLRSPHHHRGLSKYFNLRRKEVSLLFSARKKGLYGYSYIHGQVIKREINQRGFWFLGSLKHEVKLWQWFVLVSWLTLSPVLSLKDFLRLCTGKYRLQFQFWIFCLFSSKYLTARALP